MLWFLAPFTGLIWNVASYNLGSNVNARKLAIGTGQIGSRRTISNLAHSSIGNELLAVNNANLIPIAIQTRHNIEYRKVPSTGSIQTATVEVGANSIPINVIFRSASSLLNVLQQHQGALGDVQESSSQDEPHRLVHTVTKPIIQEIHEVISPFRKITQEVHPVQEEIQTIVARNTQLDKNSIENNKLSVQQTSQPIIFETIANSRSNVAPSVVTQNNESLDNQVASKNLEQTLSKSLSLLLDSKNGPNYKV